MSSRILPAGKTVQTLEVLKAQIEQIAARAEKLHEQLRTQSAREQRRSEAALEEQTAANASAEVQGQADYETAKQRTQAQFERRKAWIGKAYQSSKEAGLRKIDERIGAQKYELQKRMLQAERDQQNGLAGAGTDHQAFLNGLASEEQALAEIERAAQETFKGYSRFQQEFQKAYEHTEGSLPEDEQKLLVELRALTTEAAAELGRFRGRLILSLLKYFLVWVVLLAAAGATPLVLARTGVHSLSFAQAAIGAGAVLLVLLVLRFFAAHRALPRAIELSRHLARARQVHHACQHQAELHYNQQLDGIRGSYSSSTTGVDQQLKQTLAKAGESRVACRMECDDRANHANARNELLRQDRLARLEVRFQQETAQRKQTAEVRSEALKQAWLTKRKELTDAYDASLKELKQEWQRQIEPLYKELQSSIAESEKLFPGWSESFWRQWAPPASFAKASKFATLQVDFTQLADTPWADRGFELSGPSRLPIPLCLVYPEQGSILLETESNAGHDQAITALNTILLRLLATAPPGRVNFTILDPVGLGQNFAGVMHLADYEEQLINNKIWTQSTQIEEKLAELNEHMEKVIQMYLRNEYQTIAEYNEQAGVIAEKYRFLVIADFPANFTDVAAKRLLSIAASGARCGVFTLIHWDRRLPLPADFIPEDLRKSSFGLTARANSFFLTGKTLPGTELSLDESAPADLATEFIHEVGRQSRDSSRVEVPFEHVTPAAEQVWSEVTTQELRVPIGRTGATKLQYLEIGKGTRQHGLIAGKTGSGKSTLFHVIITNLALWCSPNEVEFYLVDFKKGVEFKCYAANRLPHARVVAIESDREFGLSVLQRLDEELRRRGDLFRQLGVQDIPGYKRAGGKEPIPRTLLMVDEFQEFFVEDDKVAQTASVLLDRIVRQGRAFGIHVLLGSQTLGGAYTVARTTLGQMVIRVALQCNEADAYLIMDENNPAPRLLSRPGEGIYNDMAGAIEGNSPFQVVWLPDDVRDSALAKVRARADQSNGKYPGPIVFEGNAPADVRENQLLARALRQHPSSAPPAAKIWLGAPNSIKGPTEVVFQRQSGNNLLILGQREEAMMAMLGLGLVSLASQFPKNGARFLLLDSTPPGTAAREYLERIAQLIPQGVSLMKGADLPVVMKELDAEMKRRADSADAETAAPIFLFIHGLQKFSRLRYEEDFSFSSGEGEPEVKPAAVLNDLICEGTRLGIHVIATCDTYNNLTRSLSRKAISEFEMRVLFQMSANDSASLIDNPKAGMLGLHRALYFNAQEGYLEVFRPYAPPGTEWFDEISTQLR